VSQVLVLVLADLVLILVLVLVRLVLVLVLACPVLVNITELYTAINSLSANHAYLKTLHSRAVHAPTFTRTNASSWF